MVITIGIIAVASLALGIYNWKVIKATSSELTDVHVKLTTSVKHFDSKHKQNGKKKNGKKPYYGKKRYNKKPKTAKS